MRRTVAALAVLLAAGLVAALAQADSHSGIADGVTSANPRAGHPPNVVASGWELHSLVQGSNQLENPTSTFDTFGFLADGAPPHLEATKTGFTFQNEGDNEPSGIHVSDGDPDAKALLGSDPPGHDAHAFFTQQHGENHVFEIVPQWDH